MRPAETGCSAHEHPWGWGPVRGGPHAVTPAGWGAGQDTAREMAEIRGCRRQEVGAATAGNTGFGGDHSMCSAKADPK